MHSENHHHNNNYWLHTYFHLLRNILPLCNQDPVHTTYLLHNNMLYPGNPPVFLPNTRLHKHPGLQFHPDLLLFGLNIFGNHSILLFEQALLLFPLLKIGMQVHRREYNKYHHNHWFRSGKWSRMMLEIRPQ